MFLNGFHRYRVYLNFVSRYLVMNTPQDMLDLEGAMS